MSDPRSRTHLRRRIIPAALVALVAASVACVPMAAARTVEFATQPTRIPLGLPAPQPKLGVTGTVEFTTNRADRRATQAATVQERLNDSADRSTAAATRADQRIAAIEQLLAEVEGDQQRLEQVIQRRLVEQYKDGDDGLEFLLSGDGLSDLVARGRVLDEQNAKDRRMIRDYELTVEKVEIYKDLLQDLRTINGEQARSLRERADRLDGVLAAARVGHDEAPLEGAKQPKGVGGTWYVMDGAFTAQLFLPNAGTGYDGGVRTPSRAPTPQQIQMVIGDKRIDLDASGMQDVLTGQIDGRLLDAMMYAAQQFGYIKVTSLKSDHDVYTSSGNLSAHSFGCAMDIGTIGDTYIEPAAQVPGGEVQQAVQFFAGLGTATGKPDLNPHQVISLFDLGGATLQMGDHGDHIHVGYGC